MEEPLESYNQAQRATTTILNTSHPAEHINFFTARPPTSSMNSQVYSTSNMTPTNMTLMPKTATVLSPPMSQESEKLVKMKNRKMKKQARKDVKNVKQVIVTEGVTDEYNIDNILEELGESESNKKSASKNSNSKTKAERKRSGKLSSSIGKKDKCPGDKLEHSAADDTTEDEEEDDEELVEKSQSGVNNSQEHISSTNQTVSPELATQAAMLNRQTSRSTEDMFTPVIKKHSKWKNKKAGISNLSKDDSVHTYSSSSSASSTTSSTVAPSSGQNNASYQAASNSHSSILSAKPAKYNLRRKSALRPSQSFDTMKSASSSVASDDLEASGNGNPASKTKSNRDHLDLATDFPPLSASEASETAKSDQFVPKWVTKTSAGNSAVPPFPVAATATIEKSRETETNTTENNDFTEKNNSDQQNNPNSSSSSMSFSPSAVIDASDVNSCKKPPPGGAHHHQGAWQADDSSHAHHHTHMLPPQAPPPDVTVVPLQNHNNVVASHQQQCTANAVMLPDIAAQAPNVMNTTNSSSGVSSNAGDLTPPQTTMMSEPPSFYQFSENEISNNSSNKPGEKKTRNGGNNQFYPETEMLVYPEITGNDDGESELANTIEFGFEVNVLDLISKKNQQHLASEDEAIVSFGNTIVLTENNLIPEVGNFLVSGNGNNQNNPGENLTLATHHQIHHQQENNCNNNNNNLCQINQSSTTTDQQKNRQILEERACFDHDEIEEEENIIREKTGTGNNSSCQFPSETEVPTAVKNIIPNYAQIVQYVAKSWSTVEQELENGLAQQY